MTLATPHFGTAIDQVWTRIDLANKRRIEGAARLYQIDVGIYPSNVSDLVHPPMGVNGWRGPYLDEIPINPFNAARIYQINALGEVQ